MIAVLDAAFRTAMGVTGWLSVRRSGDFVEIDGELNLAILAKAILKAIDGPTLVTE